MIFFITSLGNQVDGCKPLDVFIPQRLAKVILFKCTVLSVLHAILLRLLAAFWPADRMDTAQTFLKRVGVRLALLHLRSLTHHV
jgi:hypothetical protein